MINYYEVLEINSGASEEVVKAVYKALIKKYHPDNGTEQDPTGEKMRMVNEAYRILSDPQKRQEYDYQLNFSETKTDQTAQSFSDEYKNPERKEDNTQVDRTASKKCGFFSKFVSETITGINDAFDRRHAEIETAYMEACKMPDYYLINEFKESKGIERYGYARALEERGYLKKNSNGGWTPTEKYKFFY